MGYYTYHTLTVRHADHSTFTKEELEQINDALDAKGVIGYALQRGSILIDTVDDIPSLDFSPVDEAKWYDSEEDMTEISRQFPDCVFCLHGEGEDRDDVWDMYFHDGETEACIMETSMPEPTCIKW